MRLTTRVLGIVAAAAGPTLAAFGQPLQEVGQPMEPMLPDTAAPISAAALASFRVRTEDPGEARDWYNLGAALLRAGDWEGAVEPLQRALDTDDEAIERPAAYNLALVRALAGRPPELGGQAALEERRPLLEQARDGFRWVLRNGPAAADARWNLELVGRWLESEPDPRDGGGGGGAGGAAGDADNSEAPSAPELSAREALDLLDMAAEEERDVQGRRLERNRSRDPVVRRNW